MSYTTERVSYLQGLLEGLGISDATPEGKMIGKIVDVLEDIADAIDELDETLVDMTTIVIVGNKETYVKNGRMITPRGYTL